MTDYRLQAECFGRLKGALLPLGRKREADRFAVALRLCGSALQPLDMATVLDDGARAAVGCLDRFIGRGPADHPAAHWVQVANALSKADRRALAAAVDCLADWFARQPVPPGAEDLVVPALAALWQGVRDEGTWEPFGGAD